MPRGGRSATGRRVVVTHDASPGKDRFRFLVITFKLFRFVLVAGFILLIRKFRRDQRSSPVPRMFRLLLEDLGGLFVKFGQFIAFRPDIASPAFVREAECLLDKVPPFAGTIAVAIIEEELGRPIAELFARFEPEPNAAGS